jgi:IS5 family transposase
MARDCEGFAEVWRRDSVCNRRIAEISMAERRMGQMSFAEKLVVASTGGNAVLAKIAGFIDWKPIAEMLSEVRGGTMGQPGYPALMMFRVLLLQRWYGLSDPATEEALKDRFSFRHFAGMVLTEKVPDHCSIWRFREALGTGLAEKLFAEIGRQIEAKGFVLKEGTLMDASLVPAAVNPPEKPREPLPPGPDGKPANKLVKSELDPEAAWTRKGNRHFFGYKVHLAMDKGSRIIRRLIFTPANVNESEPADWLICGDEKIVYADKAYDSHARRKLLRRKRIKNGIMGRGHPRRPLTEYAIRRNRRISKRRGTVEAIFSLYKNVYNLARARYRGLARNGTAFHLAAIAMNLKRVAVMAK